MIPRILRRRVSAECAASPRPAPHHMPDTGSARPGTADAPTTPRGRPRGAGLGPSPIPTDPPEPAPRGPMATGPKIPRIPGRPKNPSTKGLNSPTGAWCSLTVHAVGGLMSMPMSQCTYRCVVLPDMLPNCLSQTTPTSLNAPTGAWCSLTGGRLFRGGFEDVEREGRW